MGTIQAFFVRAGEELGALADLCAELSSAKWKLPGTYNVRAGSGSPWTMVEGPVVSERATDFVRALAFSLKREVVILAGHTTTDGHLYIHFDATGRKVRHLAYSRDSGGWETTEGTPESWESRLFEDDERLDEYLGEACDAAERERIVGAYRERRIELRSFFPALNAFDVARALSLGGDGISCYSGRFPGGKPD